MIRRKKSVQSALIGPATACVLALELLAQSPAVAADAAPKRSSPALLQFGLQKDKAKQDLEVRMQGKKKIAFKLTVTEPCKRTVTGTAASKGGDAESDEGEDGVSYFVDEYVYKAKDGCYLAIRIDADDKRRARVVEADCKTTCSTNDAV